MILDRRPCRPRTAVVVRAAAVAGVLSGVPSTASTVIAGGNVLTSTRAAGEMIAPVASCPRDLLAAGAAVHGVLSVGWSWVLVALLPRRHAVLAGAAAGLAIAALDMSIARRFAPAVAALPTAPQVADHVVFGVVVALVRRASDRPAPQWGRAVSD